ncbi:MAG: radical SAM protein [Clostridiales bacterium]|nr:radical SAM protein [Clostridiales bacterium]
MNLSSTVKIFGIESAIKYLQKNPEKNLHKLMDVADKIAGSNFEVPRKLMREILDNPEHPYYSYIMRVINDTDPGITETIGVNFFINAVLTGWPRQEECRKKYSCNIPWAILLDPTSSCNLHCKGCWSAEYGNNLNLSLDEINSIINQGRKLGVYFYIYTGGEPMLRKDDLLQICELHSDCVFLCFTNGTLIDENFANEMLRVGNFVSAISLEGFEDATDSRRGRSAFKMAAQTMEILKKKKLFYGISACYTSENFDSVTSEKFYDSLIEKGAYFIWYFHYMPVGNDAKPELMPTPEQRKEAYFRIRKYRATKPLFAMDFQNDAEYVGGCIAGGRRYIHINANGDIEPCVFIHYSDSNIREKTLLEALQSPIMTAYHDGQPFNENMLRPCPMLENPQKLRDIVEITKARSTDLKSPESAEHLCSKCDKYAEKWKPIADELWKISKERKHLKTE